MLVMYQRFDLLV